MFKTPFVAGRASFLQAAKAVLGRGTCLPLQFPRFAICAAAWSAAAMTASGAVATGDWVHSGDHDSPVPEEIAVPATVPTAIRSSIIAIAKGIAHTVALKQDGAVVAWGYNSSDRATVPAAALTGVTAVAAGFDHSVALKEDGSVLGWGANDSGQTTVPAAAQSGVTAIAAGVAFTVALKEDGSVVAWGNSFYGQATVPATALSGVTAIAAGGYHTVALKQNGSVVAWGDNLYGQSTVPAAAQNTVVAIAAGRDHTVALKENGSVVAWGRNDDGQTTVPTAAQSGVIAIAAGSAHTVALKQDGSVVARGKNDDGQTDVPTAALNRVSKIATGPFARVTFYRLASPPDHDGDGLSDAAEIELAALGFDPLVSQPELVSALFSGAGSAGLYTAAQLQALHPGTPLISRNPATGKFKLTLDWKKSTDLTSFADFPANPAEVSVNGLGDIEFEFDSEEDAAFFRLEAE
jgi:hypothetical protein